MARAHPDFSLEDEAARAGLAPVCGIDEAGRGPWAGPVVAAAVILDPQAIPAGINDSKALDMERREKLFASISASADVGIGVAPAGRIDADNILAATLWAMAEAVRGLRGRPALALVDGNRPPPLAVEVRTVIGGDRRSLSIAAASIIAKVTRDRIMAEFDRHYPGYGFARHKGYGTPLHAAALDRLGPCPLHRRSFTPIARRLAR
jgi:ribonuclease HII